MSWKYADEYYKNYTRETWDECAERYLPLMKQLAPFHRALQSINASSHLTKLNSARDQ
jgi:hypothetical protein